MSDKAQELMSKFMALIEAGATVPPQGWREKAIDIAMQLTKDCPPDSAPIITFDARFYLFLECELHRLMACLCVLEDTGLLAQANDVLSKAGLMGLEGAQARLTQYCQEQERAAKRAHLSLVPEPPEKEGA